MRRGFTLVELLVVIGVIALVMGLSFGALGRSRATVRTTVGLSNLRQIVMISAQYASEHDHRSPAIGQPWTTTPFWGLVVQERAVDSAAGPTYAGPGILRDPGCASHYGREMERCYAANGTGRAGLEGDADDYDVDRVHLHLDRVRRPSEIAWYVTSAVATATTNGPPPTRTAGALDFRQAVHLEQRLGRFAGGGRFLWGAFDGSARVGVEIPGAWLEAVP